MLLKRIIFERKFPGGAVGKLGTAIQYQDGTWKFFPLVCSRQASRKFHPTLESCIPKWIGYPDRCESRDATFEQDGYVPQEQI